MFAAWQAALGDQTEALARIAEDFRESVARQFATEGRADDTPWPPRAPRGTGVSPVNARNMRVPRPHGPPLLVRTGALFRSLTVPGAPGNVEEMDDRSLLLGTRVPYAGHHQTGTQHLPARPMIVLTGARFARWSEIVRRHLEEKALWLGPRQLR